MKRNIQILNAEKLNWCPEPQKYAERVVEVVEMTTGRRMRTLDAETAFFTLLGALLPKHMRRSHKDRLSPKQATLLIMSDAHYAALKAVLSVWGFCNRYMAYLICKAVEEAKYDPTKAPAFAIQKLRSVNHPDWAI